MELHIVKVDILQIYHVHELVAKKFSKIVKKGHNCTKKGTLVKAGVRIETLGIEDVGRVEDPTSIARPCKTPKWVRSLVPAESYEKCLEEELPPQAFHVSPA